MQMSKFKMTIVGRIIKQYNHKAGICINQKPRDKISNLAGAIKNSKNCYAGANNKS